ncbi:putative sigma-54 modulation protein [Luteimonas sp. J16]|jgi:putative sigma-54 modulation protein|uniref:ribosome hibernation-promoting factor, HPF/YfiA family n=1 Tax=unclassified Luteimonas TaxID=2629088 RepID=UPI000479B20E|nr:MULTISPECIES: ribosome-associated translation inhibitor RaiA [unclassified Luteimonas]TWG92270.1 putative sigma-54 modulation protein [Luteimonas sp. J16]
MQIQTYGHGIEVTAALRDYVESKLERLGRHVERPLEVRVQLSLDKPNHKAEATLNLDGKALHADAAGVDMYAAIDLLVDKLDRQLLKHHKKLTDHHRGANPARDGSFG